MASILEEQEITHSIPHLRHDLSASEATPVPPPRQVEFSGLRAQVEDIIDRGFSDMWLLLDGEEINRDFANGIWRDGRPFAMVTGDQISLLGSKFSALNALLSVGVSMS